MWALAKQVLLTMMVRNLHRHRLNAMILITIGHGCNGATPDCDIVSGALSRCPVSSFLGALNTSTVSNSTSSANLSSPKPASPSTSAHIVSVPGWTYQGCWTDSVDDRTLIARRWRGKLKVQDCAKICRGYRFFGVEYSTE